jgi:hypothetical protein
MLLGSRDTVVCSQQFKSRIAPEDQPHKAIRRAGGGVK